MRDRSPAGSGGVGAVIGVAAVAGLGVWLLSRRASASTSRGSPREGAQPKTPVRNSARAWASIYREIDPDIPLAAALAWTDQESGGNVCAIGNKPPPGVKYPAEYGLSQLDANSPENVSFMSQAEARGVCQNSGAARSDWEVQLRPLTDSEKAMHAKAALAHMRSAREHARASTAGWGWDPNGLDTWKMSKLYHAGPAYVKLSSAVAKELGRPPHDFTEFQAHANAIGKKAGFTQDRLNLAWNNVANFAKRFTA